MLTSGAMHVLRIGFYPVLSRCIVPLVVLLGMSTPASGQSVDTLLVNRARAQFTDVNGRVGEAADSATVVLSRSAGRIEVSKSVDRSAALTGDTLLFTISWTNPDSSTVAGVELLDALESGLEYVEGSGTGAAVVFESGTLRFTLGNVAARDSGVVSFRAVVRASAGSVENSAVATVAGNPVAVSNRTSTQVGERRAQLRVSKLVDRSVAAAGDTLEYTLTWQNIGTAEAALVRLVDVLTADVEYIENSAVGGVAGMSGDTLSIMIGDVPAGDSGQVRFRVVVRSGALGTIENVASVRSDGSDAVSNTVSTVVEVRSARLTLEKQVDRASAVQGDTLQYSIHWKNSGTGTASPATITDALPTGLELVPESVSAAPGTAVLSGNTVQVTLGAVAPGDSGSVRFRAVVRAGSGRLENTATASWQSDNGESGTTTDTAVTDVTALPPQLGVVKRVDRATAATGDTVTYTIDWVNNGAGAAVDVMLQDALPAGAQVIASSIASSAGAAVVTADTLRVELGRVEAGASGTVTLSMIVTMDAGTLSNRALLTASGQQPLSSNTVVTTVEQRPGVLALAKSVDRALAGAGDTITWTITWHNSGTGTAHSTVVTDALPSGARFLRSDAGVPVTLAGDTVRAAVGSVAAGGSGTMRITAVVEAVSGVLQNVARAQYTSQNVVQVTTSQPAFTTIEAPTLSLTLEALVTRPLYVGDTLSFRIRIQNTSSNLLLRNAVVTDSLPEELRFLSAVPATGEVAGVAGGMTVAGGQTILTWRFGTLLPGEYRDILIHTQVVSAGDGRITNIAVAHGTGITQAVAAAANAAILSALPALAITKTASSLEAGLGDVIGYTITVRNAAPLPLSDVIVVDRMPLGLVLQPASVRGAELMPGDGDVRMRIARLGPGEEAVVTYAATVDGLRGDVLRNVAWAEAAGVAIGDSASASVRARDAVMRTQLVMGKVWLDDNADGRQQADEKGLENAVVWASSGQTVRTDAEGRFSLPDVRAGRYTLRVDPLSVPASHLPGEAAVIRVDGWNTPVASFGLTRAPVAAAAEERRGVRLTSGQFVPRPRFAAPAADAVLPPSKFLIRVEGDPLGTMDLVIDGELRETVTLRPDGSWDFIGVDLPPGPHRLEARVRGRGGDQTIAQDVHISGAPKQVTRSDTTVMRAGETLMLTFNVVDEWNVPVAHLPHATVLARGLRVMDTDADRSSVGLQIPVGANGALLVPVRSDSSGSARVTVSFAGAERIVDLAILPQLRPLIIVADGELGIGATTKSNGSATARGRLDANTAITLSYDSRRGTATDAYGGAVDPLGESQQPVVGDASQRQVLRGSTTALSLKLERDRSWLLFGDVDARGFGDPSSVGYYQRALPGVSGRIVQENLNIFGFGSAVAQQLVERQLHGDGTSGPYLIGGGIRPGTDRVAVETRDRMNASLVLNRRPLQRYVDYDIDVTTGAVLLRRPLMSSDAHGNPMMLVVLAEQISGESAFVGGIRGELDIAPWIGSGADSIVIAAGIIQDRSDLGGHTLASGDLRTRLPWGGAALSFARGAVADSSGHAMQARLWLGDETGSGALIEWNRVGEGFANPANSRLIGGMEDVRARAQGTFGSWKLGGSVQQQWFRMRNAERGQGLVTAERDFGGRKLTASVGMLQESFVRDSVAADVSSLTGRIALAGAKQQYWLEATEPLSGSTRMRPRNIGIGSSYTLSRLLTAEASYRLIDTDEQTYGVSSVGLKSQLPTGTQLWSDYDVSLGEQGRASAAVLGISQKLRLSKAWAVDAQYERRQGIEELPETDPMRGLPFVQQEPERWSAAAGVEWAPSRDVRASLRGEVFERDGGGSGHRLLGTAQASLNRSWTLLLRQESREEDALNLAALTVRRTLHSLVAMAFRPAQRSDWNAIAKLEYRDDVNPLRAGLQRADGSDTRVIGTVETMWTPSRLTEVGVRYALRHGTQRGELAGGMTLTSQTHFAGLRVRRALNGRFDVRGTARLLLETESSLTRWDVAPALGIRLIEGLDLETGYRFGDIRDADFAQTSGEGFYMALGMSITEHTGRSIADFWRARMGGER